MENLIIHAGEPAQIAKDMYLNCTTVHSPKLED